MQPKSLRLFALIFLRGYLSAAPAPRQIAGSAPSGAPGTPCTHTDYHRGSSRGCAGGGGVGAPSPPGPALGRAAQSRARDGLRGAVVAAGAGGAARAAGGGVGRSARGRRVKQRSSVLKTFQP